MSDDTNPACFLDMFVILSEVWFWINQNVLFVAFLFVFGYDLHLNITFSFSNRVTGKKIHICDDLFPGPGNAKTWSGPVVTDHLELVLICTGHGALHPVPLRWTKARQLSAEQWQDQQCADSCPDPQAQLLLSTSMYK